MRFIPRGDWGAPPTSPAAALTSARGTKVHWLGTPYTSRPHSQCAAYVRQIRASHLAHPTENYVDIAYNLLVCEHGYVFEGRGVRKRSGANGSATLNTGHYAVCALHGTTTGRPPDALLSGLRDAIDHLRANGAGGEVLGHRDGHATACPGDALYAWVRSGAPRPSAPPPPAAARPATPSTPEDAMPERALYATVDYERAVQPGEWRFLNFNRRYDGTRWIEKDAEPSILFGPCYYSASFAVRVAGLERGRELQMRLAHYQEAPGGGWERAMTMPIASPVHDGGRGHFVYSWTGFVPADRRARVRCEVVHFGDEPVTVDWARAEALYWPA